MTVHFNFVVSDEDAENILNALQSEVVDCICNSTSSLAQGKQSDSLWFKERALYMKNLISKMKNTRVKQENGDGTKQ